MDAPEEKIIDGVLCRKVGLGMWKPVVRRGGARAIKKQRFVKPESPVDELINEAQRILGFWTKTETITVVGTNPSTICRIRHGFLEPSPDFILKIHDATGMSIEQIRAILKVGKLL